MLSASLRASRAFVVAFAVAGSTAGAGLAADQEAGANVDNPDRCKVVELKPGEKPPGGLSVSVSAGNGHVSARTTGPNGVTVHAGNGQTSSSVATATTGSGNGSATTVTTSDGHCVVYVRSHDKTR